MTDTTAAAPFAPGDLIQVSDRYGDLIHDSWAKPGTLLRVKDVTPSARCSSGFLLDAIEDGGDRSVSGYDSGWFDKVEPPRPLVDFSGDSRATARLYAAGAIGKNTKPKHRALLQAAADGEQVDAYALNEALAYAFRHAATRYGQSMARREAGKQIAHLAHIVQAVLEAHADDLPVYADSGVRSRKIEELTEALDLEQHRVALLLREKTDLEIKFDDVKDAANEEISRHLERAVNLAGEVTKLLGQREVLSSTLTYALELLAPEAAQRVLGFRDGVETALGVGNPES